MRVLAFVLTLILFWYWYLLGRLFLIAIKIDLQVRIQQFLSPALGLVISLIPVFMTNRMGIPLRESAYFLFFTEVIIAVILISKAGVRRNLLPSDALMIFIPLATLVSGWPILKHGFSWISYVNDDMNNEILSAQRFYNYGFFDKPKYDLMTSGSDYSLFYYHLNVTQGVRSGSHLLLAYISRILNGETLQIFMPTIMALQAILISATIGLSISVWKSRRHTIPFTLLCTLLLPLFSLGFLYQLIGQVGGIGIAITLLVFLHEISSKNGWNSRSVITFAILCSGQLLWYPEFVPFLLVIIAVHFLLSRRILSSIDYKKGFATIFLIFLILQRYLFTSIHYMYSQITGSQISTTEDAKEANASLFPYFLKPHGLASIFGFTPLNVSYQNHIESFFFCLSLILLVILIIFSIVKMSKGNLASSAFIVCISILVFFISTQNGFASFKISMYLQPFLAVILTGFLLRFSTMMRSKQFFQLSTITFTVLVLAVSATVTNNYYSTRSSGDSFGGFNELPYASQAHVEEKLKRALSNFGDIDTMVISPAFSPAEAKLQAYSLRGTRVVFPTRLFFDNIYKEMNEQDVSQISTRRVKIQFPGINNSFDQIIYHPKANFSEQLFLLNRKPTEIFNKSNLLKKEDNYDYALLRGVKNHLFFVYSQNGQGNFTKDRKSISIWQAESDPMHPGAFMQSLGRELLFQVFDPQKDSRFVLAISSTLMPQNDRRIPRVNLSGQNQRTFPLVGRGSARVYLDNPIPAYVNNYSYFQLSIQGPAKAFPAPNNLIEGIYNSDISQDNRKLTTFGQDISFVDNSKYSLRTKKSISMFPKDLEDNQLFYSGIYEDGWFSENSYVILDASNRDSLVVKGTIPLIGTNTSFTTSGQLLIDGKVIATKELRVGDFNFTILNKDLSKELSGNHRIEVKFSKLQRLPGADGRPVSAKILFMGFTSAN